MAHCDYCDNIIDGLPFHCRRCGGDFCPKHRLPEEHNCPGLRSGNIFKGIKAEEDTITNKPIHRRKKHYYEVDDSHKREYVGTSRQQQNVLEKSKLFLKRKFYQTKSWLNTRHHHGYSNWNAFFMNTLWIVILSISFMIIYSNIAKLNEIVLWFLPLGGTLLLINVFFWIKYFWKLLKKIYYWYNGERNWIKYLILIILISLLWQAYQNRDTIFNPMINLYDKIDFSSILPIGISKKIPEESIFSSKSVDSIKESVKEMIIPQPIDSKWVDNFMSEVNAERKNMGLQPMRESADLNAIAYSRFNTMMKKPEISHYGAGSYNLGEVVFYPSGSTPSDYVKDIQNTAPLHWDLLVNPIFSYYGYYVGEGQTVQITGSCPSTEIPGPNINVVDYFEEQGCQTTMASSMWLVIDMT